MCFLVPYQEQLRAVHLRRPRKLRPVEQLMVRSVTVFEAGVVLQKEMAIGSYGLLFARKKY